MPRVTVVIPTYRRPAQVRRAVADVLGQTMSDLELIVIVDGRDAATIDTLQAIDDRRLRFIVPNENRGNAEARNLGVREASAKWIAFLDDDDEWMPTKLEEQLAIAEASDAAHPLVTCRMIARAETQDFVWPRRQPRPGEPLSDYLFCRSTPLTGEGMVQTSTWLTGAELLRRVQFARGMRRYVDLDWILRAAREPGFSLEFVANPKPLSVWHIEENRSRISNGDDATYSLHWAREHRDLLTRRAYAGFLLWLVSRISANSSTIPPECSYGALLAEARREGTLRPVDLLTHTLNFAIPRQLLRSLAAMNAKRQNQPGKLAEAS